jgi:hypothetical protein
MLIFVQELNKCNPLAFSTGSDDADNWTNETWLTSHLNGLLSHMQLVTFGRSNNLRKGLKKLNTMALTQHARSQFVPLQTCIVPGHTYRP